MKGIHTKYAEFKQAEGFILWKALHMGTRGYGGSEYVLQDLTTGRFYSRDAQKHFRSITGEVTWVKHGAYQMIMGETT